MKLGNGVMVLNIPNMSSLSEEERGKWNRWIEALESGKYSQARCQLRHENSFCCLGVVQDILKDEIHCKWVGGNFMDMTGHYRHNSSLIFPTMKALGTLRSCGLDVQVRITDLLATADRTWGLDQLNDSGATFKEIAQVLRTALNGGFEQ